MIKVDIFSGFLGAGKTTLIKKLIKEAYAGEKLVLIENEFGEISVDGGFLQDVGVEITEMSSGCICCSLVGDFAEALKMVAEQFHPDRILIEPSGVGKLSDVIRAVQGVGDPDLQPGSFTTVVDATRAKMYLKNFGEFWCNQVENANCIILSRTSGMSTEKLAAAVALLREKNADAAIVTTPWNELDGKTLRAAMEKTDTLRSELAKLAAEADSDDDDDDDDDDEDEEHGHHHEHDHEHEHHHEHGETCSCGHHDEHDHDHHHHHHGHDADEVFTSWGTETPRVFVDAEIKSALAALESGKYGQILRAKGYVSAADGWLHFDYVPGESDLRRGPAGITGRLCVIGSKLDEQGLKELFKVG
jgi:G3E family GTPase